MKQVYWHGPAQVHGRTLKQYPIDAQVKGSDFQSSPTHKPPAQADRCRSRAHHPSLTMRNQVEDFRQCTNDEELNTGDTHSCERTLHMKAFAIFALTDRIHCPQCYRPAGNHVTNMRPYAKEHIRGIEYTRPHYSYLQSYNAAAFTLSTTVLWAISELSMPQLDSCSRASPARPPLYTPPHSYGPNHPGSSCAVASTARFVWLPRHTVHKQLCWLGQMMYWQPSPRHDSCHGNLAQSDASTHYINYQSTAGHCFHLRCGHPRSRGHS